MPLLIRKYKGSGGVMQEERIDDPDRIERYMRLFEEKDVKKLGTGVKTGMPVLYDNPREVGADRIANAPASCAACDNAAISCMRPLR